MALHKYGCKDLNEIFSKFKDPRIQHIHALNYLHSLYVGFGSANGLDDNEKGMLRDLKKNGNDIFGCQYNDVGHVMALYLKIHGKISDFIYFPHLYWLTIRNVECKNEDNIKFIAKHGLSINLLDLRFNDLTTIPDISSLTELKLLDLANNNIEQFNWFGDLPKLDKIVLSENKIKSLQNFEKLGGCQNLKELDLSYNKIKTLKGVEKLGGCPNLKEIDLSHNKISDLCEFEPLSHIPNLSYVSLSDNKIKDLNITFNVPKLTHLNLSNNKIDNIIALKNLSGLKSLGLSYNKLIKLENLEKLPKLEYINIEKNPVCSISKLEHLPNLLKIEHIRWKHCSDKELDQIIDYITNMGLAYYWYPEDHVDEWSLSDRNYMIVERPESTFEVNTHLVLNFIDNRTVIFVNGVRFDQYVSLLLSFSEDMTNEIEHLDSIDELSESLYQENDGLIKPEVEF